MKVSIVLPAYQEAENLKNILPNLHISLREIEHEILVIDTIEPTDDTKLICLKNQAEYIARENGNSYGDAIRTGFAKASGIYTVVMDADGSHDPADIMYFYEEINKGYDLVIGSRYCKGGYTDNSFILRFMSRVLNIVYRVLFGLSVKDVSDSFRMYRTSQIQNMELECTNFDIVEEILIKLNIEIKNFSVKEVPISFHKRAAGESKRDLIKFILSYFKTITKLLKIKKKAKRSKC